MLIGWILLCLPFCVRDEAEAGAIDHLFTAVSAVSTTGLATVGTPTTYTAAGQVVILLLIQAGGIGYMTLGSFVLLARHRELTEDRQSIARLAFSLPEGFRVAGFLRNVVLFTLTIETIGAVALYAAFRRVGVEDAGWQAMFHSVSAFCTAGFSIFPSGLEAFPADVWVNAVVAALSLSGAIGFLVMSDLFWSLSGRREKITLTSRIILHATFWTIAIGWALIFLIEPSLRSMPAEERLMASGFQAMTALTTVGFNTVPIGSLGTSTTFLMLLLMILGASPSGTGGGLKSTSVSAALATTWSVLKSRPKVTFWGCEVPQHRLTAAFASLVFYVLVFFVGGLMLLIVQSAAATETPFEDVVFEAASALGTVGLSRGATGELTPLGKLVIIGLMFIGRVGPVTFGLALLSGGTEVAEKDDLAI